MCFGWNTATISTVTAGKFSEEIPQSGNEQDGKLVIQMDQMYQPRIKKGLTATSYINNDQVNFVVSDFDSAVVDGRFSVTLDFADTVVSLHRGQCVRLRIALSEPREATLLEVGGFYKDTGGTWIYVLTHDNYFVKRNIKLGPKNPEYFTVLEGLKAGDQVITSSYENLGDKEQISLWQISQSRPLMLM